MDQKFLLSFSYSTQIEKSLLNFVVYLQSIKFIK